MNYLTENADKFAERYMIKRDPDLWAKVLSATSFLQETALPKQRCWHILNDSFEAPICPVDGIPLPWWNNSYSTYSSQSAKARCSKVINNRTAKARSRRGVIITEREQYRKEVWKYTKQQWSQHKHKVPLHSLRSRAWHLDHKISIEYGYKNGIDASIIGHWCNFEILRASDNYAKHSKSSITLEDLLHLIEINL